MLVSYMPLGSDAGLLATDAWGNFVCSAGDGECKRAAEATVPINDRGGQAYAYKPELP